MKRNGFVSKSGHMTKGGSVPRPNERGIVAKAVDLFKRRNYSLSPRAADPGVRKAPRDLSRLSTDVTRPTEDEVARLLRETIIDLVRTNDQCPQGSPAASQAESSAPAPLTEAVNSGERSANAPETEASTDQEKVEAAGGSSIALWKRALDLILILLTFPCWLPLMVVIMVWVKLVSAGPVFYRQERVGYRKNRFMIFKFRTMLVNAETQTHEHYFEHLMQTDLPMSKLDSSGDPRLIRLGRYIRAAGLDELPQLFNILRGDMSIVGPRPCTLREFARYQPRHLERFDAPPGLTGFWQVHGKNKTTFSEMIAMDIIYARRMSLRLDLLILAKTLPAVARQIAESCSPPFARQSPRSVGRNTTLVS